MLLLWTSLGIRLVSPLCIHQGKQESSRLFSFWEQWGSRKGNTKSAKTQNKSNLEKSQANKTTLQVMLGSIFLQTENRGESQTHLTSKNFLWFPPNTDDTLQTIWQRRAALRVRLGSGPCCFSRTGCRHLCSALGHAHFAQNSLACCSQSSAGSASTIHKLSLTKDLSKLQELFLKPFPCSGPDNHKDHSHKQGRICSCSYVPEASSVWILLGLKGTAGEGLLIPLSFTSSF